MFVIRYTRKILNSKSLIHSKLSKMSLSTDSDSLKTWQVDQSKMNKIITPELIKLVDMFHKYDHEIRIAGGAVRDLLSGEKIPDDIDLATTATPTEMKDMFEKESIRTFNEQGEKHGTVCARIGKMYKPILYFVDQIKHAYFFQMTKKTSKSPLCELTKLQMDVMQK